MCVFSSSKPSVPQETEQAKQEREAQKAKEQQRRETAKAEQLEETVSTISKGIGRRSLLTGSRAGLGYYSETL